LAVFRSSTDRQLPKTVWSASFATIRTNRLEIALTVIAAGIVITLAMSRVAFLGSAARQAADRVAVGQARAASNLSEAHCALHPGPARATSSPCPSLNPKEPPP
jgi:hypothetical protein